MKFSGRGDTGTVIGLGMSGIAALAAGCSHGDGQIVELVSHPGHLAEHSYALPEVQRTSKVAVFAVGGYLVNIWGDEERGFAHDLAASFRSDSVRVVTYDKHDQILDPIEEAHQRGERTVLLLHSMAAKFFFDDIQPELERRGIVLDFLVACDPTCLDEGHLIQPHNKKEFRSAKHLRVFISNGPLFEGRAPKESEVADPGPEWKAYHIDCGHLGEATPTLLHKVVEEVRTQLLLDELEQIKQPLFHEVGSGASLP